MIGKIGMTTVLTASAALVACDGSSSDSTSTNNAPPSDDSPGFVSRGYADVIVDSFDAGNVPDWPFGRGATDPDWNMPVKLDIVLGPPSEERIGSRVGVEFLSVPEGNYVTVGFTDEVVVDGEGADLEIVTLDDHASETANIYIGPSTDDLVFAGTIGEGGTTPVDLGATNYDGAVSVVRIEGLDNKGGALGFDLMAVQAINYTVVSK